MTLGNLHALVHHGKATFEFPIKVRTTIPNDDKTIPAGFQGNVLSQRDNLQYMIQWETGQTEELSFLGGICLYLEVIEEIPVEEWDTAFPKQTIEE